MSDNSKDKTTSGEDKTASGEDKSFSDLLDVYSSKNKENSFEHLLDSYSSGMNEDIKVGDKIKGKIISIGQDTVFIDTKSKIDGSADKGGLLDENGEFPYEIGDSLELYVVSCEESEIILSRMLSGIGGLNILEDAYNNKIPIEGKVVATCKGGFHVETTKRKCFCPVSQMDIKYIEKPDDYIGGKHQFLVTRFEENGRNIVVSRRVLLEQELEEKKKEFFKELTPLTVFEGQVTRILPFGAFVELSPGIEGMVHVSEISWSRVEKPEDILSINEKVRVQVLEVKGADRKISLSIKQALGDPWNDIQNNFQNGDKVTGKVTRCADFGVFVEIASGIEGLVHISEMSYTKRVLNPEDMVSPGDTVSVMIKDIDAEKRRVSLSLKAAEGDPWLDVSDKYSIGQPVTGTIEKKEQFGYFITLAPGITGLFPKSKITQSHDPSAIEKLKTGDSITVSIEDINTKERKITLRATDSIDGNDWKKYSQDSGTAVGSLGEKLKQALEIQKHKK